MAIQQRIPKAQQYHRHEKVREKHSPFCRYSSRLTIGKESRTNVYLYPPAPFIGPRYSTSLSEVWTNFPLASLARRVKLSLESTSGLNGIGSESDAWLLEVKRRVWVDIASYPRTSSASQRSRLSCAKSGRNIEKIWIIVGTTLSNAEEPRPVMETAWRRWKHCLIALLVLRRLNKLSVCALF